MKNACLMLFAALILALAAGSASANVGVEGTYKYLEPGYEGTMVISQMGPGFSFTFKTTSKSNGQMCDFTTYETPIDEGGGRVEDDFPAMGGTSEDGIKFKISFQGNEAAIDMESKGEECGMSGYFGGKYEKISR